MHTAPGLTWVAGPATPLKVYITRVFNLGTWDEWREMRRTLPHEQILDAIKDTLNPLGCAVVIEASHLCMMMRGVQKQNSVTTTSAFFGEFEKNETRSEFIKLISADLH